MLENELAELKEQILDLHKLYYSEIKKNKALNEGVLDFESDDLGFMFEEARKRFMAAKKAISIVNKLGDPTQKARVFSNFNKLRAFVARLTKTINDDLANMQAALTGKQMFDPRAQAPAPSQFGSNQQQSQPNQQQRQAPQQAPQQQQAHM